MKHIGVRDFKNRATSLFREAEPVAVERHGTLIGFYIPVEPSSDERARVREALTRLDGAVKRALSESGLTEDELASYFDTARNPPETKPKATPEATPE